MARPTAASRRPVRRSAVLALAGTVTWLLAACSTGTTGAGDPHGSRPPSASSLAGPTRAPAPSGRPLAGKVVVLDPGHNIRNQYHTARIDRLVDIGDGRTQCDTTGTATDRGYPEATFTLDVARRARALLTALGARVVLTQDGNRAYGPCVDERARIGDAAHADAAVSVHADGAAPGDRGFHVILPAVVRRGVADTRDITGPSRRLGVEVRDAFARDTGSAYADYVGGGTGLDVRGDLGGLNLSTVPKVFVECGNMRDSRDAARLTDAAWRQRAARGIADGIAAYLEGSGGPGQPG